MSQLVVLYLSFQRFQNRFKLKSTYLILLLLPGVNSCTDKNITATSNDAIILKGGESQDITLYGNKYSLLIADLKDNRCYMNATALGDYGLEVQLLIKSQKDCLNDTCKSQKVSLFLPNCDSTHISVDDLFSDTNKKRGTSQLASDFFIGISHATPYQTTNPPKIYALSDYELTLFTKK